VAVRRPVVVSRRGTFLPARLRLRRREVLWWVTALGLAVLTVTIVAGATGRGDAAAERWGRPRTVLATNGPLEIGQVIGPGDVGPAEWPATLVPPDAVTEDAEGRVVAATMAAGELVVEGRLAPDGLRGPVALLPPDTRALAVPDVLGGLDLRPGDRVDLLAVDDPFALGGEPSGAPPAPTARVVAAGATVVAVADDSTTVAVPLEQVAEVAATLGQGVVTLALASPLDGALTPTG
jgi:pilus assembly protein CpaB